MKGAESEQPVRSTMLPVGGLQRPAYICRDQRKGVFHNMGPFKLPVFVSRKGAGNCLEASHFQTLKGFSGFITAVETQS